MTAPAPRHTGQHRLGGLALLVAGEALVCRPSGALWLERFRVLVVADLHLEKGSFFATRGQMLPPYDSAETLRRLAAEAEALDPRMLVFLGDSFHDRDGDGRLASGDVASLCSLAAGRTMVWITGNHDPTAPRGLPGETIPRLDLGDLHLVHETRRRAGPRRGRRSPASLRASDGARRQRPPALLRHRRRAVDRARLRRVRRRPQRPRRRVPRLPAPPPVSRGAWCGAGSSCRMELPPGRLRPGETPAVRRRRR